MKPLKAPKKGEKDMDENDVEFLKKKKEQEKALKEAAAFYQGTPVTRQNQAERKEVNKPNYRAAVTAANVRIIIFQFWHKSSFSQCWILHLIFFDILSHPLPPFYIVKQ